MLAAELHVCGLLLLVLADEHVGQLSRHGHAISVCNGHGTICQKNTEGCESTKSVGDYRFERKCPGRELRGRQPVFH